MIVYGDPSREEKLHALIRRLDAARKSACILDDLRALLLLAGEMEQGVADAIPACPDDIQWVTDHAADAFLARWDGRPAQEIPCHFEGMASPLKQLDALPDIPLTVKRSEGFAFYALYPEQYAMAARRWMDRHPAGNGERIFIAGIRTIGTTLSAVVAAALRAGGREVRRLTVRPSGHPYERCAEIPPEAVCGATHALVVDEGPGLSGSSMAAVAEALIRAGVPADRITFLPDHEGAPGGNGSEATQRWWSTAPCITVRRDDLRWSGRSLVECLAARAEGMLGAPVTVDDFGGGLWRRYVYPCEGDWPAVCAGFERPKYRCTAESGERLLWAFAGLAPDGMPEALDRQEELARTGWTPVPLGTAMGFIATPWVPGAPLTRADLSPEVLEQIGEYIAEAAGPPLSPEEQAAAQRRLADMLYWNVWEGLGEDAAERTRAWSERALAADQPLPSYGDGRMAPHEWRHRPDGRLVKTDAWGHDRDHTVVGRQPVSWDVAGALAEWGIADPEPLLAAVRAAGGPDIPVDLLTFHRLSYAAFRLGMCTMGVGMTGDPSEQARLNSAADRYRRNLFYIG